MGPSSAGTIFVMALARRPVRATLSTAIRTIPSSARPIQAWCPQRVATMYRPVARIARPDGPSTRRSPPNNATHGRTCAVVVARRRLARLVCSSAIPANRPSAPTTCKKTAMAYSVTTPSYRANLITSSTSRAIVTRQRPEL